VPELRRGEERRPLHDAVCVTHGGFVIFHNTIARFADNHGTYRWAQMLLKEDVEVPPKEVDQFVKAVGAASTSEASGIGLRPPDIRDGTGRHSSPGGSQRLP
jgi:hypothetical protein